MGDRESTDGDVSATYLQFDHGEYIDLSEHWFPYLKVGATHTDLVELVFWRSKSTHKHEVLNTVPDSEGKQLMKT